MRGIEGALLALKNAREGRFIGETLRALPEEKGGLSVPELSLASSLAYAALRRESLWREVFGTYLKKGRSGKPKLAPLVSDCLLVGTAGLLELRTFAGGALVNGLLELLKAGGEAKAVPMANAILRSVGREGAAIAEKFHRSANLEERALWAGIPEWTLPAWKKSWNNEDLFELFEKTQIPPRASLRASPGKRDLLLKLLKESGNEATDGSPSDLFPDAIRLPSTVLPTLVPGFKEGLATVQTESSMLAASLVGDFYRYSMRRRQPHPSHPLPDGSGGLVLDMCSGRGIKAGQILQSLRKLSAEFSQSPAPRLECWELSPNRHLAAEREMERLGLLENVLGGRVALRAGNALQLTPAEPPFIVFLDAPCTGSGTWHRKPESKWQLTWPKLDKICELQRSLLGRALNLAVAGGIIIYVTCSLLRQENENAVAEALAEHPECVVLDVPWSGPHVRRGRPWGTYIWPDSPWLDGFYAAVFMKKS